MKGYCQSAALATRSGDDWSWSMHGNLLVVCAATDYQRQVTHRLYKFNMDSHDGGWMGRFQVRAMHIKTALINAMKFSSWFQCKV